MAVYGCCIYSIYVLQLFFLDGKGPFQLFLGLSKEQLKEAVQELKEMTPETMHSMLVYELPREEAVTRKREERHSIVTMDVPPQHIRERIFSAVIEKNSST